MNDGQAYLQHLRASGLSVRQIAAWCQVTRFTVYFWLNGQKPMSDARLRLLQFELHRFEKATGQARFSPHESNSKDVYP